MAINVQTIEGAGLELILPLLLCCVLFFLRSPQGSSKVEVESDSWYVSSNIQETYDKIVQEVDEWRKRAESKKTLGISSLLSRKKPEYFNVEDEVSPRLYRVKDKEQGEIAFELAEVEEGGTSIKSTYEARSRVLIQNFKAKLPVRIPATGPKVCPSCGKEVMQEFTVCPYCGTKLK